VQLQLDLHASLRLAALSELLQLEEAGLQDAWLLLGSRAGEGLARSEITRQMET
jgi:hypothetical protein